MHRFDVVGDSPGFAAVTHDTELHHGVVVSGQVTDRSTGRPVRAHVVYAPLFNNALFTSTPGYERPRTQLSLWIDSREMTTDADGRYRLTGLPGPGARFVRRTPGSGTYMHPAVSNEDQNPAIYHARAEVFLTLGLGDIHPVSSLHAYRLIHPAADATALTADFALDPGLSRKGRLIDPDGKPISGAEAIGLSVRAMGPPRSGPALTGTEFTAEALNPDKPRRMLFWHPDRKLAGTVVLRGDEPEPVTVTLQPLAGVSGRAVLKTTGEPLVGYAVEYSGWPEVDFPARRKHPDASPILTDNEGRFRLTDLPAGVPLNLSLIAPKTRFASVHRDKVVLEPGTTKEMGELRGDPPPNEP